MSSQRCFETPDEGAVKHVRARFKGRPVTVPVQAVRRTCGECGEEFWAWPDTFDWMCAKCQANDNWRGGYD